MKLNFGAKSKILFLCALFMGAGFAFAAPKKSSAKDAPDTKTKIEVPKKSKGNSYFSKIDAAIVENVEIGSPDSLKKAMADIRKSEYEYTDNEKVLIIISSQVMKRVWTSEKITWDTPSGVFAVSYTGALDSVAQGLFDSSTGNTDFLSTILPALLILNNDISQDNLNLCEAALTRARTFRENSVLADYLCAVLYEKKGDFERAFEYISRVYGILPRNIETRLTYAEICKKNGKVEESYKIAKELLAENPSNLDILKSTARIAFDAGDYAGAEEYVARVLLQVPNNLEFLLFRAVILIEKKDYIHAVSLLDMYARQNDTNVDYLLLRCKVQLEWSKNTALATETIEKTLSLYPDNKDALLLAARIASASDSPVAGKYADELVAKVLETDSENQDALLYALNGLVQREQWKQAYEISSKLVQKQGALPDVIFKHAEICLKLGKNSEAMNLVTAAYNANPGDETILQAYITVQSVAGSKTQTIALINSLLDSATPKTKSFLLYQRSFLQDNENSALADLRSSLISNPRNSDALFRLYEIYYAKSDYRKAQYYLKQVVALKPNDTSVKKLNESLTKLLE